MRALPILAILLLAGCAGPPAPPPAADEATPFPLDPEHDALARLLAWFEARARPDGCVGPEPDGACTYATTRDAVIALSAIGVEPARWAPRAQAPAQFMLAHHAAAREEETFCRPCSIAKGIVAFAAVGLGPDSDANGSDLDRLDEHFDGGQVGDPEALNDDAWALFAYRAADALVPDDEERLTERFFRLREHILANQNTDGGWGWRRGVASDAWTTATMVLALEGSTPPRQHPAIDRAVSFLRSQQAASGLILQDGSDSAESTAIVIQALHAVGEQPGGRNWTRGTVDLVEALLSLQDPDGGFRHNSEGGLRFLTTTQVAPALRGVPYPFVPPTVTFGFAPAEPSAGSAVTFQAFGFDPDGAVVRHEWAFGDGAKGEGRVIDHAYASPGHFTVRLRVEDDDGVGRAAVATIEVVGSG